MTPVCVLTVGILMRNVVTVTKKKVSTTVGHRPKFGFENYRHHIRPLPAALLNTLVTARGGHVFIAVPSRSC